MEHRRAPHVDSTTSLTKKGKAITKISTRSPPVQHQPPHSEAPKHTTVTHHSKKHKTVKDRSSEVSSTVNDEIVHDAGAALIEQRLATARKTTRLDGSVSKHSPITVYYQLFPWQVVTQEKQGLCHLTELWLTNHHITSLPPEIGLFTNLRLLGLGGNALSTLPDEIRELRCLESLYLEKNQLMSLPASVEFPFQLRDLHLDSNSLTMFPPQLTKLRLLNRLGLSRNQIRNIPTGIRRLTNLVELDLDYNCICPDLPDEFTKLRRLERLGLEGNRLREFPECLKALPALMYVRISANRSNEEGRSVPIRHDGYFQCSQRSRAHEGDTGGVAGVDTTKVSAPIALLDGLVPCRDQNLLNAETYRDHYIGSGS